MGVQAPNGTTELAKASINNVFVSSQYPAYLRAPSYLPSMTASTGH